MTASKTAMLTFRIDWAANFTMDKSQQQVVNKNE